ncbi:transcription elongation factor GreA [Candidatus Cryosericum terrychapinii]|jgi:transcription elongation factor GreA|nr:transcription elongation factor GreA [Candidatus Cryosericum terrychapinii]
MMHDEEEHFDEEIEITNVREDEEEKLYISPSQHKKMLEELDRLKTKERLRIAERIKEAKGFGDLSENAEYEEAKKEQAFIEGTIMDVERQLEHSVVVEPGDTGTGEVHMGCKVQVLDVETAKTRWFTIVGNLEADPMEGHISIDSPVGKALVGKREKETVAVRIPKGRVSYRILSIEKV